MADIVTKNQAFFEELLSPSAAKWSAGVAFDRSNGLPLDQWSVFQTEAKATEYLTSAKAYPGQIIAYAEANGEMKVCVLSQNAEGTALTLKPVGIIPTGDNKTIEVSAAGAISLFGAAGAQNGTLPFIDEQTGKLVWRTLEDIGAGDGNDNTTYEFAFANQKITITPKFNGQPVMEDGKQVVHVIDLTAFVTAEELEARLEQLPEDKNTTYSLSQEGMVITLTPSEGDAQSVTVDAYNKKEIDDKFAALPEDKDTTYTAKADDKVLKLTGTEFATEIGLKHENGKISLTGVGGAVIAEFSDAEFVADGVLEDVSYDATKKELTFTWNTKDAEGNFKTDTVNIADLIDTYTAGNGLELSGSQFAVKRDSASEDFLTVSAKGVKLAGVQEAINAAQSAAEGVAATKASEAQSAAEAKAAELANAAKEAAISAAESKATELANAAKQAAIDDAATKYATTGALDEVKATAEAAVTEGEMSSYVAEAIKDKADRSELIDAYNKTEVNNLLSPITEKLNGVEAGAQVNKIEVVKVNGTAQTVTEKAIDITVPTKTSDLTNDSNYLVNVKMRDADADAGYTPVLSVNRANNVVSIDDEAMQNTIKGIKSAADTAVQSADFAGKAMTKEGTKLSITQKDAQDALGLKSAAYAEATDFAPADIDTGVHAVDMETGDNNGEVKLTVDGTSKNVKVKGLGSAAYTEASAYDAAGAAAAVLGAETDAAGAATVHGALNKAKEILGTANDGATANTVYGAKAAAKANAEAIEELKKDLGNLSNIMNFRGVVEHKGENTLSQDVAEAGIGDLKDGDVIIHGEKEYVYSGGAWHEFGDATGNAAAIEDLTGRVQTIEGWKPENASNSKAGLIKGTAHTVVDGVTTGTGVHIEGGEVKSVSTDLLVNGTFELILCGGSASV